METEKIMEAFRFLTTTEQVDFYNEYAESNDLPQIIYLSRENFNAWIGDAYNLLDKLDSDEIDSDTYTHGYHSNIVMSKYFAINKNDDLVLIDESYVEDFILDECGSEDEFAQFVYENFGGSLDFDEDDEIGEE